MFSEFEYQTSKSDVKVDISFYRYRDIYHVRFVVLALV